MILIELIRRINIKYKLLVYKIIFMDKVKFGKSVAFRKNFNLLIEEDGNVEIGDSCFFNNNCSITSMGNISIGDNCIFGEEVKIYDHNHIYKQKYKNIKDQGFNIGKVSIGKNCWIGSNVIILNNVDIGDNVIIGANCLIYKSIQSNTIVKCKSEIIIAEREG